MFSRAVNKSYVKEMCETLNTDALTAKYITWIDLYVISLYFFSNIQSRCKPKMADIVKKNFFNGLAMRIRSFK